MRSITSAPASSLLAVLPFLAFCAQGSAHESDYELSGTSSGQDFTVIVSQSSRAGVAAVPGLPVGAGPDEFAAVFVDTLNSLGRQLEPPLSASLAGAGRFVVQHDELIQLQVGSAGALCTVGIGAPCAFDATIVQLAPAGEPGVVACSCDGSGAGAPCGNDGEAGSGCANSTGVGAILRATGSPGLLAGDLALVVRQAAPEQPGVFLQGDSLIAGGAGLPFGGGLRCCSSALVRLEVVTADPDGGASSSVPIAATGGAGFGDTRCYQYWYRDPDVAPCTGGFNLSNAYTVTWVQ